MDHGVYIRPASACSYLQVQRLLVSGGRRGNGRFVNINQRQLIARGTTGHCSSNTAWTFLWSLNTVVIIINISITV